ncbi:MAG: endonuclease G, mitochondrial, partial [Parcubacteria group bacterium Gr01-1014_48]
CQQKSTALYTSNEEVHYDRGHLVPANHFDHSQKALKQTNYITNIVPQAREMNRGAWLRTEEIIECYRDTFELVVVGGVLWGDNKADDYFLKSHGIATPDAFWKVIVRDGHDVIAWIIPNSAEAKRERLDTYIVSVADIENRIKQKIADVPRIHTDDRPEKSWPIPAGCSKK